MHSWWPWLEAATALPFTTIQQKLSWSKYYLRVSDESSIKCWCVLCPFSLALTISTLPKTITFTAFRLLIVRVKGYSYCFVPPLPANNNIQWAPISHLLLCRCIPALNSSSLGRSSALTWLPPGESMRVATPYYGVLHINDCWKCRHRKKDCLCDGSLVLKFWFTCCPNVVRAGQGWRNWLTQVAIAVKKLTCVQQRCNREKDSKAMVQDCSRCRDANVLMSSPLVAPFLFRVFFRFKFVQSLYHRMVSF